LKQIVQTLDAPSSGEQSENAAKKTQKNSIGALDGARAVAALLVVALHLNEYAGVPWNLNQNPLATALAVFGRTGVILFFFLSGFLLFLSYARSMLFQEAWPSARTFYLRRIFRIWPGYYFSLAVMLLWYERQYLQPAYWKRLALFLTFFMDSSPQTWQKLNGPFWTLAIEWQFYLLLPLIAFCFSLLVKRYASSPQQRLKAVLSCCGGLILLSLAIRGFGVYCQRNPDWTFLVPRQVLNVLLFFTFGMQGKYLEVFALGISICACYTYAQHPVYGLAFKARLSRLSDWNWKIGIIVLFCVALWQAQASTGNDVHLASFSGLPFLNPLTPYYAWLGEPIAGVGYGLCILAILSGSPVLRWFFELPALRWIGLISYSMYMWNQKLLDLFYLRVFPHLPHFGGVLLKDVAMWVFVFTIMMPLCFLFYCLIEKPGIRLGNWVSARRSMVAQALQTRFPTHLSS
jgi:peptidoglycan/LPS O-acetylase OafA/YrhL